MRVMASEGLSSLIASIIIVIIRNLLYESCNCSQPCFYSLTTQQIRVYPRRLHPDDGMHVAERDAGGDIAQVPLFAILDHLLQ